MSAELNPELQKWFIEKLAQNPEYLWKTYLPAIQRMVEKSEYALDQALQCGTSDEIRYRAGWRDGVREIRALLGGLKIAESRKPLEAGLMSRILSFGNLIPSNPG